MDTKLYHQMAMLEQKHWWFLARRSIISHLLNKLNLPAHAKILEAGCGTGGNLSLLSNYGHVYAMESNEIALDYASRHEGVEIQAGSLPDDIPFQDEQFDLIVMLDVLEHLEDDSRSLNVLHARLKSNGWLLVTVPALPFLWSKHDEIHHHYRRYIKTGLCKTVEDSGYQVVIANYFNFMLFPLILIIRRLHSLTGEKHNDDLALPPRCLNWTLKQIFASERYLINRIPLPVGVSLILLAKK